MKVASLETRWKNFEEAIFKDNFVDPPEWARVHSRKVFYAGMYEMWWFLTQGIHSLTDDGADEVLDEFSNDFQKFMLGFIKPNTGPMRGPGVC